MSDHEKDPEQYPTRVVDKRGQNQKKEPLPTAEELLEQGDAEQSEFERQKAEEEAERARLAAWEELSEDERQAILAQQAAEMEAAPFAGGGLQVEGETKKEVLTAFAIVVDLDGTATAMPMRLYEEQTRDNITYERDADPRVMYRSCSEILLDIQVTESAHTTLQFFRTVGDHMAAQQRAQALAQQLDKRGARGKRH